MAELDILVDAFGRIQQSVHAAVQGLSAEQLAWRADASANSVGWLAWHLTRVQDSYIAELVDGEQVWTKQNFVDRFGLSLPRLDTGYRHTAAQVAEVRVPGPDLLLDYHDATHDRTVEYLGTVKVADLDKIVDYNWNPPVSLSVRLVSVIADDLQHAGQAAFIRGLLLRRAS